MKKRELPKKHILAVDSAASVLEKHIEACSIKRRRRGLNYLDLREYLNEILEAAKLNKCSKRWLATYVRKHFKINASADQVYRFVKSHNNGVWPNQRPCKEGKNDQF